jgi:hypothetical protein
MFHCRKSLLFSLAVGLALGGAAVGQERFAPGGDGNVQVAAPAGAGGPICGDFSGGGGDPVWDVSADGLIFNRSGLPSQKLLVNSALGTRYNADEFSLPEQFGWEFDVQRRFGGDWAVEGRFFDLGGQDALSPFLKTGGGAGILYSGGPIGIFGPSATSQLAYYSELRSAEVNAWTNVSGRLSFMAGVRYFDLDDRILVHQFAPGGVDVRQRLEALNDMIGFQLGANVAVLRRGPFSLDAIVKAGIYDDVLHNVLAYDSAFFAEHARTSASTSAAAFSSELGITLGYEITPQWSIRGGYQLLWLDGVAVASQQAAVNPSPLAGPAAMVLAGTGLFYNGAFLGVEFRH